MAITISTHSTEPNYNAIKKDALEKNKKYASNSTVSTTLYYNYSNGKEVITEGFQLEMNLNSIEEFLGKVPSSFPSQVYMRSAIPGSQSSASVTLDKSVYQMAFAFKENLGDQDFLQNIWVTESVVSDISNLSGRSIKLYNCNRSGEMQTRTVTAGNGMFVNNVFFEPKTKTELQTELEYNKTYPYLDTMSATALATATNYPPVPNAFIGFVDPTILYSMESEVFMYIGTTVHRVTELEATGTRSIGRSMSNSPMQSKPTVDSVIQLGLFYRITGLQYEQNRALF